MARRLATEAKIVLERAGYDISEIGGKRKMMHYLYVCNETHHCVARLNIDGGTVDNAEVVKLLDAKGFTETGHKKKAP